MRRGRQENHGEQGSPTTTLASWHLTARRASGRRVNTSKDQHPHSWWMVARLWSTDCTDTSNNTVVNAVNAHARVNNRDFAHSLPWAFTNRSLRVTTCAAASLVSTPSPPLETFSLPAHTQHPRLTLISTPHLRQTPALAGAPANDTRARHTCLHRRNIWPSTQVATWARVLALVTSANLRHCAARQ
jgi:hypothetical protein